MNWRKIKHHGTPPDGKWIMKYAPNARIHIAHVNGPFIQVTGQRWPLYMADILGDDDEWTEYNYENWEALFKNISTEEIQENE